MMRLFGLATYVAAVFPYAAQASEAEGSERNVSWQFTNYNRNGCCSDTNLQIRTEAHVSGLTDLIEVNFAQRADTTFFIESFLCPNSPSCEIQSIFRAFVQSLAEYNLTDALNNDFTSPLTTIQLPTSGWIHSETNGSHYFETQNDDGSFRFFCTVANTGNENPQGDSNRVKWGFEVSNFTWSGADGETVLALRVSLGSKGTAAVYKKQGDAMVLDGIEAVYGINGMTWDPIITIEDGSVLNVSTVGSRTGMAYSDLKFIFGSGTHFSSMLWDPVIGGFSAGDLQPSAATTTTANAIGATTTTANTTGATTTTANIAAPTTTTVDSKSPDSAILSFASKAKTLLAVCLLLLHPLF